MNRSKKIKKTYPTNLFATGGNLTSSPLLVNAPGISVDPSKILIKNPYAAKTASASPNIGAAISGGLNLATDFIGNFNLEIPEVLIPEALKTTATSNSLLLSDWNSWSPIDHITEKDLGKESGTQTAMNALGAAGKGAASGAALGSVIPGVGTVIGGAVGGLVSGIGSLFGSGSRKRKIRKAVKETNAKIDNLNDYSRNTFAVRSNDINISNANLAAANYSAYGGNLLTVIPSVFSSPFGSGAIAYEALNNLINLEFVPSESFQLPKFGNNNQVYAFGGLMGNGVTTFDNGGTHEENPNQGIPLGIGLNGLPNLVEEGEVKYKDYIFSNRINANEDLLSAANLPKKYNGKSMAEISKAISKESSERPNDPISKRGLTVNMNKLTGILELLKSELSDNVFAKGGKKTKLNMTPFTVPNIINPTISKEEYDILNKNSIKNPTLGRTYNEFLNPPVDYYNTPEEIMQERNDGYTYTNPNYNNYILEEGEGSNNNLFRELNLRYAPVLGAALGLGMTAFSGNDKFTPDYTGADTISGLNVAFDPIGNYMSYNPLDRNYYLNMMNALAGATRRGIVNLSAGNRATATAGLLAADYNYLNAVGSLGRQAEEYNLNQRQMVENFNRGTNMFNSEAEMKAALTNNEYKAKGAAMRSDLTNQANLTNLNLKLLKNSAISANLSNLFDSIGDIGREATAREMIRSNPSLLYDINRFGTVGYKKAKGGKLNKRNKNKGLTDGII